MTASCDGLPDVALGNPVLTPAQKGLLTDPDRWRLFAAGVGRPRAVAAPARQRWSARHPHRHGHVEILVVLAGRGYYGWDEKVYALSPGRIFVFGPDEPHDRNYPPAAGPARHLWLSVLRSHYVARILACEPNQGHRSIGERLFTPDEVGVLPDCFGASGRRTDPGPVRLRAALTLLLSTVAERGLHSQSVRRGDDYQRDIVGAIERHILDTAGQGASLDDLARIAGYTPHYFLRIFRRYTGRTPQQFVDTCRRTRARELLARGWSKRAVSEALGFAHPSAYRRWERKHM